MLRTIIATIIITLIAVTANATNWTRADASKMYVEFQEMGFTILDGKTCNGGTSLGYIDPASMTACFAYDSNRMSYQTYLQTVMHESVHLVQLCVGNGQRYAELLTQAERNAWVSRDTKQFVINSYGRRDWAIEIEAEGYAMQEWRYTNKHISQVVREQCAEYY